MGIVQDGGKERCEACKKRSHALIHSRSLCIELVYVACRVACFNLSCTMGCASAVAQWLVQCMHKRALTYLCARERNGQACKQS